MGSYSKILVAFDGSDSSKNALRQAIDRFEKSWMEVLIVVPAYEGDLSLVGVPDMEAVRKGPIDKLVKEAREIVGPESARVKINAEEGVPYEKIVDEANSEDLSLIVMGRRGLRPLERMLMGSVTAKVIVHSPKDVLVVPKKVAVDWGNILVASDGSAYSQAALDKALEFAQAHSSKVTVVSVVDMYPEYYADAHEVVEKMEKKTASVLEDARAQAGGSGTQIETELLHGDPADEINSLAEKCSAGVIFLGTKGRSGIKKMFMGSVAQKVIGLSHCPVFVTKPVK